MLRVCFKYILVTMQLLLTFKDFKFMVRTGLLMESLGIQRNPCFFVRSGGGVVWGFAVFSQLYFTSKISSPAAIMAAVNT